jgi:nicotinamidase-related amidase
MEFKGSDRGPFVPALIVVDMQEDFCPPVSLVEIADHIAREARTC